MGGTTGGANHANSDGWITGTIDDADGVTNVFRWKAENCIEVLGTCGGLEAWAYGINDDGVIAGYFSRNEAGLLQAFVWSESDGVTELADLGGGHSVATDISSSGVIVGDSKTGQQVGRAVRWDSPTSSPVTLPLLPGGTWNSAQEINADGQIILCADDAGGNLRPCLWAPGTGTLDLGTLGGTWGVAWGLNDSGVVAGYADTGEGNTYAFIWDPVNGMTSLGTLPGYGDSIAYDINNDGVVAGQCQGPNNSSRAFVWTAQDGMIELPTLGGFKAGARGISNQGWPLGTAMDAEGIRHAVFWVPINEPCNCLGDLNSDGNVDGLDIPFFADLILTESGSTCADMDFSGGPIDFNDVAAFTCKVVGSPVSCPPS